MILLIGSTGYIGSEFLRQLQEGEYDYKTVSHSKIFGGGFEAYLKDVDYVINASGYTGKPNVDKCEEEKDKCIWGNVVIPQKVIEYCGLLNIPYCHVSSGCIYQGRRSDGNAFDEYDEPNFTFKQNNCSFYSGTKALAEDVVKRYGKSYIWRLRIPFDEEDNPRNYISKLLTYKKLVNFENSVSHRKDFVSTCLIMVWEKVPYGIYNVVNTGTITTELATTWINDYLDKNKEFDFVNENEFYKNLAKTPRSNCVLDNSKLRRLGIEMRDVKEAFVESLQFWKKV
jgi:dTDP-4-dehydrorhamnose reductase